MLKVSSSLLNFLKKDRPGNVPAADVDVTKKINIIPYMEEVASILQVEIPTIQNVDCLFESNYYNGQYNKDRVVIRMIELHEGELPPDASFLGAYYFDKDNMFFLSNTYPMPDPASRQINFVRLSPQEHLFTILHEMRHSWQKKYHAKTYYKKNAVGMEVIHDPAEIDADAFALAYIFSSKTSFTPKDLPTSISEMRIQGGLDMGKRWARAKKLSKDYSFGESEKLTAARG